MIESWKKYRDKHGYSAAGLMDLSKAFDPLTMTFFFAKLRAYGIKEDSLKLLMNYLNNRQHWTKVGGEFSALEELLTVVP